MITRKDIAAHLERGIRTGFLVGARDYTPLRSAFVQEKPSDGAFEIYADMGAVGWPRQNAGNMGAGGSDARTGAQVVNQMNAGGGIQVTGGYENSLMVYNVDFEIVKAIEHNAIDDDRAGDLEGWARAASVQFERHKDYLAFDALNQGAATTYGYCYDGVTFIDANHADPGAIYSTVQDNEYALTLSPDNFETVRVGAAGFLDGDGKPVGLNHNLLIFPPALEREAYQITDNPFDSSTANRQANPYNGKIQPLEAPGGWLDATAWFLVDPNMPVKPLNLQIRKEPGLVIWDDETQGSGIRYFKLHARYAMSYGDWRLCVQGNT